MRRKTAVRMSSSASVKLPKMALRRPGLGRGRGTGGAECTRYGSSPQRRTRVRDGCGCARLRVVTVMVLGCAVGRAPFRGQSVASFSQHSLFQTALRPKEVEEEQGGI